jgi:Tfp pilus assembly protein PilX
MMVIMMGKERGSALVLVMGLVFFLLVVGSIFIRLMGTETMISENLETRVKTLYFAESGIHAGIVYLQENPSWNYLPKARVDIPLAGGTASYRIDTTSVPNNALVVGTGTLMLAVRELEVTVRR